MEDTLSVRPPRFASISPLSADFVRLSTDIIAFLVLSVVLLGTFVLWEHTIVRSPRLSLPPMLPLEIFSRQKISLVLFVGFLIWASFQPFLLYTVLYYQQYLLLSPMATMVRQLPTAVRSVSSSLCASPRRVTDACLPLRRPSTVECSATLRLRCSFPSSLDGSS